MIWRNIILVFFALLWNAPSQAADTTPLIWGAKPDAAICKITDDAVWVEYSGGRDCIRYFASGDLNNADVVIVVLRGDRTILMNRDPDKIPDNTAAAQKKQMKALAKQTGYPVILLARPGTYGSTGNHLRRRQAEEFLALNAALDAIRQHFQINQFVLSGHSGGATAVAAMLTMGRSDIRCAVMTSGAYGLLERAQILRAEAGQKPRAGRDTTGLTAPYDPLEHIAGVAPDTERKIFIIGNLSDRITPFLLQRRFAETLEASGHTVQLMMHQAVPPNYHNLRDNIGLRTAALCAGKNGS